MAVAVSRSRCLKSLFDILETPASVELRQSDAVDLEHSLFVLADRCLITYRAGA
jgi:hypothetical protein